MSYFLILSYQTHENEIEEYKPIILGYTNNIEQAQRIRRGIIRNVVDRHLTMECNIVIEQISEITFQRIIKNNSKIDGYLNKNMLFSGLCVFLDRL